MAVYDVDGNNIITEGLFVNVMAFGAKGNGVADDATAIQNALNSIRTTGGVVYFPEGTYKVGSAVQFYSNSTLFFEPGATLLQGASMNNMMRSFCDSSWTGYSGTHDCLIYGATFDGGDYTTNNTLVGIAHAKNIIFENCTFKNAYGEWHNIEINSSYNVKVINCDFEGSRKTSERGELIQIDWAYHSSSYPWNINIDNTVCELIEIYGCTFHNSMASAIGTHSDGANNRIRIHDNNFDSISATRGTIYLDDSLNLDIYDNTFDTCTLGVGSSGATWYIHDNRFIDVTTAIGGSTSVAHANMINGTYTA